MTGEDSKRVAAEFYEAGNVGDIDRLLGLLDDDIVWTNIGTTRFSMTCNGKQELIDRLIGPLFGRLKNGIVANVSNMIAEGEWVAIQCTGEATTTDGQPYNNTYCHVFRVRDNKIVQVTEYFDTELVNSVFADQAR